MAETWKTEAEMLASLVVGGEREVSAQDIRDCIYSVLRPEVLEFQVPSEAIDHVAGKVARSLDGRTFDFYRDVEGVVANLPEELQTTKSRNNTGANMYNGDVVYITGAISNRPTFGLADKRNATANKTIAVLTHDVANNADGYATAFGAVRDLDTTGPGAETWNEGDELFLGNSGQLTNVRPTAAGDSIVSIGYVLYSHASSGIIWITIRRDHPIYLEPGIYEARPLKSSTSYMPCVLWSWTDFLVPVQDADRRQNQLTQQEYRDTDQVKSFADRNSTTILSLDYQMPHEWAGTDVELHWHAIPCGPTDGTVEVEGSYFFDGLYGGSLVSGSVVCPREVPAAAGWTAFAKSMPVLGANQHHPHYTDLVTCVAPANPAYSDILRLVVKRVPDTYIGSNPDGDASANLCIEWLDIHYQRLIFGSAEEYSGTIRFDPAATFGDPADIPGREAMYVTISAKSAGGQPVSFRVYNVTDGEVVQLVAGGDAELTGLTNTDYQWFDIGPLVVGTGTKEYRIEAKYDSAADEPRLAHTRIKAR